MANRTASPPPYPADASGGTDRPSAIRSGPFIWDLAKPSPGPRSARRLQQVLWSAVAVAWRSGPKEFLFIVAAQLVAAVGLAGQLFAARSVLARVVADGHVVVDAALVARVGALVGMLLLIALADLAQRELGTLLGERVGRSAADRVLDVTTTVGLDAFEQPAFYDRVERARFTAANRHLTVVRGLVSLLGAVFASAGLVAGLVAVQPVLALVGVVGVLPLAVAARGNSRLTYQFNVEMVAPDRERSYLWGALSDRGTAKEVRAYGLADYLRAEHDARYDARLRQLSAVIRRRLRRSAFASLLRAVITGVALAGLLWLVDRGTIDLAQAGTAIFALLLLSTRLAGVTNGAGTLYESALFLEDYESFVGLREPAQTNIQRRLPPIVDDFALDRVSFRYPGCDRPAVNGISLQVRRGEVIALVGPNGSGKTTVAKLLGGLHVPTTGVVTWAGVAIDGVPRDEVREHATCVFQDFVRWSFPAATNIGFGRHERLADRAAIVDAAKRAGAHELISALPEGYDTLLGRLFKGSVDLSVGQWQRIAVARALFRDAPLVILDEPTSALDPVAEYELYQLLRDRLDGQAVVLISHRFSSARLADRVYVLDHGSVVEEGTHDSLISDDGLYARMFRLQATPYLSP